MKFKVLTLFPEIFPGPLAHSISGKALKKKLFSIKTFNIRDFSDEKSKTVDDSPYGGGAGMILRPDCLQKTLDHVIEESKGKNKIIFPSPGGKQLNSQMIREFMNYEEIILVCGRYEGIDNRFLDKNKIEEISIGDYILSCGEIASIILIDACVRLIPEVLGNEDSLKSESFQNHLLEYPQYTKPYNWYGLSVPEVLLSGNHKEISDWRLQKSIEKTKKVRPDLFKNYIKQNKERK